MSTRKHFDPMLLNLLQLRFDLEWPRGGLFPEEGGGDIALEIVSPPLKVKRGRYNCKGEGVIFLSSLTEETSSLKKIKHISSPCFFKNR